MGRNYKERQSYAYLHGLVDKVSIRLKIKWNRRNWNVGKFRALRKHKREKIINTETKKNLNEST